MAETEQENIQKIEQENLLEGKNAISKSQTEEFHKVIQLVQSKEAKDEIAKLEKQYRETIERENK